MLRGRLYKSDVEQHFNEGRIEAGGRSMPKFSADGVEIYYEVTGEGYPLVWSHEFGGSYESWETQVDILPGTTRSQRISQP